jgi:hypothetical protein
MTPGGGYRIKLVELLGGVAVLALVFALGLPTGDRLEWIGLGHVRWLFLLVVALIAVVFELTYWFGLVPLSRRLGRLRKR